MKKLFIFVSSLVMAPMIYSATSRNIEVQVYPVFMPAEKYSTVFTAPTNGIPFKLSVNLQDNTVQDLIDAINQKANKPDANYTVKILDIDGKNYFNDPRADLEDTRLRTASEKVVTAIFAPY